MAKDKVVIRWDTKCAWNGKEQPIARKTIDPPSPANLVAGQKVRVKFSGRWYDAFVVTPWIKQPRGKRSIVDYFVFVRLTPRTSHELN